MPGGTLNLKVFAKYVDPNASNSQALLDLIAAIGGAAAGVVVDGAGYASSTPSFPIANPLVQTPVGTAPKAYLNCLTCPFYARMRCCRIASLCEEVI